MMISFERETYLLYADAATKVANPECKKILHDICKQTKGHMNKIINIHTKPLEYNEDLDDETRNLLLDMKNLLTGVEQNPLDLLKTCCRIERRMGDIYEELSREKELEAWYEEQLGHDPLKKYVEEIGVIFKQLSDDERFHEKLINDELNKYMTSI